MAAVAICENCGDEFTPPTKYNQAKTCSKACRYALSAKKNREVQGAHYLGKTCPQCGDKFDGKSTFCGRVCSNKARSGDNHPARNGLIYPSCKVCGRSTQHTQRATCPEHRGGHEKREHLTCPCGQSTESFTRLYCSEEHRETYGKKKAPVRMVEHTCLGCGETFERPHFYPGKLNYCSNKCSHSQQKKIRDKYVLVLNEHAIVFHSGYEIRFYAACLRFDIPCRSYDGPDFETSEGTYRPDFIVNDDIVIDVKGYLRPESKTKADETGVTLVTKQDLFDFEDTGTLSVLDAERV